MDISNAISLTGTKIVGVLLFYDSSNFLIYGYQDSTTGRGVLLALSSSFNILYNNKPIATSNKLTGAASDGTGNAYFAGSLGNPLKGSYLLKYEETTWTIQWQKSFSHSTSTGIIEHNLNFHATISEVAFVVRHDITEWSAGGYDFLFLSVDAATGSSIT